MGNLVARGNTYYESLEFQNALDMYNDAILNNVEDPLVIQFKNDLCDEMIFANSITKIKPFLSEHNHRTDPYQGEGHQTDPQRRMIAVTCIRAFFRCRAFRRLCCYRECHLHRISIVK